MFVQNWYGTRTKTKNIDLGCDLNLVSARGHFFTLYRIGKEGCIRLSERIYSTKSTYKKNIIQRTFLHDRQLIKEFIFTMTDNNIINSHTEVWTKEYVEKASLTLQQVMSKF